MKKSKWSLLAMLFALLLVLAACGDDKETTPDKGKADKPKEEEGFAKEVENKGTAIKGGTLMVAMEKDSAFQGIFNLALYSDGYDSELIAFASTGIFDWDGDYLMTNDGIASYDVNEDTNEVTVTIKKDVKWSDGQPLTVKDLILPYYIIGHKDYDGERYDSDFRNIIGAEEYHAGAETISGITVIDDYSYKLSLKTISPGLYSGGDGIITYALPDHVQGSIPVTELIEHDSVRKNPLSLGAFVISNVVPGESVEYKRNEHYWKGTPKLDGVIVKVVPPASVSKALENGEYDLTVNLASTRYAEIKNLKNIDILAKPELYYQYLGFKLGKWNTETVQVETDESNSKVGNVKLRQAMGYALNVEEVAKRFYDGLRERANAIVPPVFSSFHDPSLKGYTYDPKKAKALLDEAGYKDVDGDGLREDPKGEKFQLKFATMSGDDVAESISSFWLQNWADVGLDVVFTDGRSIEFNSFYDRVKADDPEIDLFMAAFGVGSNPSPSGIYANTASFNYSRYTSPTLQEILKNIDSDKSFDSEYRAEQFAAFEKEIFEKAPVIPITYRLELTAVNKRVKFYTIDQNNLEFDLKDIELLSENGVK